MTTQNVFEKFFSSIFGGSDDDAVEQKAQLRPKARPEGLMSSLRPKARPSSEETEEPDKDATMGFVNNMLPYYSRKSNTTAVLPFSASRQAFMNNSTLLEELQAQREASVSGLTTVTARSGGRYSPIDTLLANSNKFIDDEADDLAFDTMLALGRKPEVQQPVVDYEFKEEFDPKSIQQNLVDKGYDIAVDGIIGTQTKKAIKDFQKKSGLKDDGIVGPNTARALGFDSSASKVTTETLDYPAIIPVQKTQMELASEGGLMPKPVAATVDVTEVSGQQQVLKDLGYAVGAIDGIYGNKTKAAVIAFQKDTGLSPDGKVGPLTKAKLLEEAVVSKPASVDEVTEILGPEVIEEGFLPKIKGLLPSFGTAEFRFYKNNLFNPGSTFNEDSLNKTDIKTLRSAVSNAIEQGRTYTEYKPDFGYEESEVNKESPIKGLIDPYLRMARSLGVFNFTTNDKGEVLIDDTFDYNSGPRRKAYYKAVQDGDTVKSLKLLSEASPVQAASMIGFVKQEEARKKGDPYKTKIFINLGKPDTWGNLELTPPRNRD